MNLTTFISLPIKVEIIKSHQYRGKLKRQKYKLVEQKYKVQEQREEIKQYK